MREEAQGLVKLIRASIDEAQLRSGVGGLSPHHIRNVIALMWAAHDELELIAAEANRKPSDVALTGLMPNRVDCDPA